MNKYLMVFILIIAASFAYLLVEFNKTNLKVAQQSSIINQKDTLLAEFKNLNAQYEKSISNFQNNQKHLQEYLLENSDFHDLKKLGITNPNQFILENLDNQTHLLPKIEYSGTFFFGERFLLTHQHCLAYFNDGHTMGIMLLSYEINGKSITWKKLSQKIL